MFHVKPGYLNILNIAAKEEEEIEAINDGQLSELSSVKFIRAHREINARTSEDPNALLSGAKT